MENYFKQPGCRWIWIAFISFVVSCGGSNSRSISQRPVTIGIIPFTSEILSPNARELNEKLLRTLHSSGNFRVVLIKSTPDLLNLEHFDQLIDQSGQSATISSGKDFLKTLIKDSSKITGHVSNTPTFSSTVQEHGGQIPRWILTGSFIKEVEFTDPGTLIPYILYRPSSRILAEMEFRLYDAKKKGWVDINRLQSEEKQKGMTQVINYDPSDPSLAITAKERQLMRDNLYSGLLNKMVASLEKHLGALQ